jgi:hypothetical protein
MIPDGLAVRTGAMFRHALFGTDGHMRPSGSPSMRSPTRRLSLCPDPIGSEALPIPRGLGGLGADLRGDGLGGVHGGRSD